MKTAPMSLLLLLAVFLVTSSVNGAVITIRNQCDKKITACATCCGGGQVNCYALNGGGGNQELKVGSNWPAGVVWGFPGSGNPSTGNNAKPQANLAELTIGANGQDFYDISNVDAYNLPMKIKPVQTTGGACNTIVCDINGLNDFCKGPNFLTGGPGFGCKNRDGPGLVPTDGTKAFKSRCPKAYSYSKDDQSSTFTCKTGSNYDVVFCPGSGAAEPKIQQVVSEDR